MKGESKFVAPWPGSHEMPRWNAGPLVEAPRFTWKNWFAMLGPGVLVGGSAIGGGEWLAGPAVTARYGGALMWLATLSILGQVFYNVEISRYALYTGEPIFTGKFRTLPGPRFWLFVYLILDFGAVFPYLAANAATPLAAVYLGRIPAGVEDESLVRGLGIGVYLAAMLPLIFGGKIYNTLKLVMSFKIVSVLGFLLFVAIFFSGIETWSEIFGGFFRFGTVPVKSAGGDATANVFVSLAQGRGFPTIDFSTIAILAAFAAVAGSGGLSNAPISNYTRDQGWGMGRHVGAIPSVVGGRDIQLSHVGMVFEVTKDSLVRWRHWIKHVLRDQLVIWMPACFLGMALPSMLSVQFLPRGTQASDWYAAGMTADGVKSAVAGSWGATAGSVMWYGTLVCGFLVLAPTMATSADGAVRRWVDVIWTSSRTLRAWDPKHIRIVYFGVLVGYMMLGLFFLSIGKPLALLTTASAIMNFALGFSCFHTLVINLRLLPGELRPGWFARGGLVAGGLFFTVLATITAIEQLRHFL
ncbi:MAG: Nramp family divalent metal transporter [Pirellulales bacterium]